MSTVTKNPEVTFLNQLNALNNVSAGSQLLIRYGLSKYINRESLVTDIDSIESKLKYYKEMSDKVFAEVHQQMKDFEHSTTYMFTDNDIAIMVRFDSEDTLNKIKECYNKIVPCFPTGMAEFLLVKDNMAYCKTIAKERIGNIDVIAAYHEMAAMKTKDNHETIRKDRGRPLVLIADVNPAAAEVTRKLVIKDYLVTIAETGPQAVRKYIEEAPDCVILDLCTPILNGMETSLCIKSMDLNAHIIMMSTDPIQQSIIDSFNSGAGDFIKKPVSQERILQAVKKSPYITKTKKETLKDMQDSEEVFVF